MLFSFGCQKLLQSSSYPSPPIIPHYTGRRWGVELESYFLFNTEPLNEPAINGHLIAISLKQRLFWPRSKTKQCLHFICFRRNVPIPTWIQETVKLKFVCMFYLYVFWSCLYGKYWDRKICEPVSKTSEEYWSDLRSQQRKGSWPFIGYWDSKESVLLFKKIFKKLLNILYYFLELSSETKIVWVFIIIARLRWRTVL